MINFKFFIFNNLIECFHRISLAICKLQIDIPPNEKVYNYWLFNWFQLFMHGMEIFFEYLFLGIIFFFQLINECNIYDSFIVQLRYEKQRKKKNKFMRDENDMEREIVQRCFVLHFPLPVFTHRPSPHPFLSSSHLVRHTFSSMTSELYWISNRCRKSYFLNKRNSQVYFFLEK